MYRSRPKTEHGCVSSPSKSSMIFWILSFSEAVLAMGAFSCNLLDLVRKLGDGGLGGDDGAARRFGLRRDPAGRGLGVAFFLFFWFFFGGAFFFLFFESSSSTLGSWVASSSTLGSWVSTGGSSFSTGGSVELSWEISFRMVSWRMDKGTKDMGTQHESVHGLDSDSTKGSLRGFERDIVKERLRQMVI